MDDTLEKHVRGLMEGSPVIRDLLRFELVSVEPGQVTFAIDYRTELSYMEGAFQGTVTTALAEFAGAFSCLTLVPLDWPSMTLEQSIHFTGPAVGDRLVAEGKVISPGRTASMAQVEVYAESDGKRQLCAVMTQTNRHIAPRK